MRSGGDIVVVGIKDAAKLIGISIISCCAVLVCTMFLNFHADIVGIKGDITSERAMVFYDAQVSTSKVVCIVSGGCLLITSVIMLIFYNKALHRYAQKGTRHFKGTGVFKYKSCQKFLCVRTERPCWRGARLRRRVSFDAVILQAAKRG